MKVIFFSGAEHTIYKQLLAILKELTKKEDIESHKNIQSLSERLKMDTSDISIILLLIPDKNSLSALLMIRNLLIGHRIIVVLPDQENETLSKAHSLYPRFISYKDTDFEDLKAVIGKMLLYLDIHSKQKTIQKLDGLKHIGAHRVFIN